MLCNCPGPTAIPNVHLADCYENFGQIQKIILQRKKNGSNLNTIADPDLEASWTALLSAADDTKVVQTPYLSSPESTPGEAIKFGGGNQTLNGAQIIVGKNATRFACIIFSNQQRTIEDLKKYECEGEIVAWFINEYGQIGCIADDAGTPTTYYGVPIQAQSFFIGDKKFGGKDAPDANAMEFMLAPNWSDKFKVINPEAGFNPLEDLATPSS